MIAQLEMTLRSSEPETTTDDLNVVLVILAGRGWMTARQIAEDPAFLLAYPGKSPSTRERFIRAIAHAGRPQILSYPGSPGYKLYTEATPDERRAAPAVLRHQGRDMIASADLYEAHEQNFPSAH